MDSAAQPGGGANGAVGGTWFHNSKGSATLDVDDDVPVPAGGDGSVVEASDPILTPLVSKFDTLLRAGKRSSGLYVHGAFAACTHWLHGSSRSHFIFCCRHRSHAKGGRRRFRWGALVEPVLPSISRICNGSSIKLVLWLLRFCLFHTTAESNRPILYHL